MTDVLTAVPRILIFSLQGEHIQFTIEMLAVERAQRWSHSDRHTS